MTQAFENPADAIAALAERLEAVPALKVPISEAYGYVLAEDLEADRDSPASDVSAMDGFALRATDAIVGNETLNVVGTVAAGQPAPELPPGVALKIFTGAPVPANATTVVRREDTREIVEPSGQNSIVLQTAVSDGQNIRRRGENTRAGQVILSAGRVLKGTKVVAVASFGAAELTVHRKVRVCVLNTGDELQPAGAPVQPWQIRDSNGPFLTEWLGREPWLNVRSAHHVRDTLEDTTAAIERELESADAIILSGGVSMGDADYVPAAIKQLGGNIVFHRLPIRPGKPVLGAVAGGKLILGCPGNPASVAVTARIFGMPLLSRLAGIRYTSDPVYVKVQDPDDKTLSLHWYRLVQVAENGQVELVAGKGSGDVVALAASDGIIAVPPGRAGSGPWPYYPW